MTDYLTNNTDLTKVADAIRSKGGTSDPLVYPDGFVTAIGALPAGASNKTPRSITFFGWFANPNISTELGMTRWDSVLAKMRIANWHPKFDVMADRSTDEKFEDMASVAKSAGSVQELQTGWTRFQEWYSANCVASEEILKADIVDSGTEIAFIPTLSVSGISGTSMIKGTLEEVKATLLKWFGGE